MKKSEFLKDVEHEVKTLKKLATKQELNRLDFSKLDTDHENLCIYGQITGSCASDRAEVLMNASCIRVMNLPDGVGDLEGATFTDAKPFINGKNEGQGWEGYGFSSRSYRHLSVLEAYICLKGAKNKHIIAFLKDEVKELKL